MNPCLRVVTLTSIEKVSFRMSDLIILFLSVYCENVYNDDRFDDSSVVVDNSISLAEEVFSSEGDCTTMVGNMPPSVLYITVSCSPMVFRFP